MSLSSTVGIAKTGTMSLRATVPEGIVAFLQLEPGDKLEWRMDIMDGERVVLVRKKKSLAEEAERIASEHVPHKVGKSVK